MIKCVVFDFDGVLIDSNAVKRKAYFDIFEHLANARDAVSACLAEEREGDRYQVIKSILARLSADGILASNSPIHLAVERYAVKYGEISEAYTVACREIPGASKALIELNKNCPLYVNSATPQIPLRQVVVKRGWGGYFKEVLGGPVSKSDNLSRIIQREGLGGKSVLFVGDSQRDFAAAQIVGCNFLGIRNADNDFFESPAVLAPNLNGLIKVISENWGGLG